MRNEADQSEEIERKLIGLRVSLGSLAMEIEGLLIQVAEALLDILALFVQRDLLKQSTIRINNGKEVKINSPLSSNLVAASSSSGFRKRNPGASCPCCLLAAFSVELWFLAGNKKIINHLHVVPAIVILTSLCFMAINSFSKTLVKYFGT